MTGIRYGLLIISLAIFVVLVVVGYQKYPLWQARYYNREISVAGVQLMMTVEELQATLGKGEFIPGMGGDGWRFDEPKIFVMTSAVGLFADKVAMIDTENSAHSILGIRVGEDYLSACKVLEKRGFKNTSQDCFTKGNVLIQLFGGTKISRLRIGIQDPAYKDVVF
ncbi:MAG: hypothetical protein ACOX3R_10800 [Desulfitobacteriia bacterium]|jgi:hypothetical protein